MFQLTALGGLFLQFSCKPSEKVFFPTCKPSVKQTYVSFLVFVSTDASSSAKIASFETVVKGDATLKPVQKQWNAKGTNRKLLSTDLVNTKFAYYPVVYSCITNSDNDEDGKIIAAPTHLLPPTPTPPLPHPNGKK